MQSEVPSLPPAGPEPDFPKGLPPVVPPSGKFLAQLFLVPALIVSGAVLVLLGFSWLAGGPRSPADFLAGLRNSNPDVRWRTASDLSQVLPRDERLARDPAFALDLAGLLREELDVPEPVATRSGQAEEVARQRDAQHSLIHFLCASLGHFQVPAGAPLLAEIARTETGPDAETTLRRRQNAVWSLGKLGEKLQGYDRLSEEERRAIESVLEQEAAGQGDRAVWAEAARQALPTRQLPAVGAALVQCARDPDPLLRKLTAVALIFWDGPHTEETLDRLAAEAGRGGQADSDAVRRLEVRYQATAALALRGSPRIDKRLDVLAEMLDEEQQLQNFRVERDGRSEPDYAAVQGDVTNGLQAVAALHRKRPDLDLSALYPAVDRLAGTFAYAVPAKQTQLALGR